MLHGVKFVLHIEADKMGAEHIPNLVQVLQWCLLTLDILVETEDDPKLIALCICDQHTKLAHVVPTPAKGGRYLKYLTTELCRFVVYTQHTSVTLRTDMSHLHCLCWSAAASHCLLFFFPALPY